MADENLTAGNHQAGEQQSTQTAAGEQPEASQGTAAATPAAAATSTAGEQGEGSVESYDLKLPDDGHLPASAVEAVEAYAKKHGISNAAAQEALDFGNGQVQQYVDARQSEWQKQVHESWPEELKADPEFGGDAFAANADKARGVLEKFGPPGFKDVLNETGFGNNPMLLKWALNVANAMSEDELVTANKGGGTRSQADRLFGNN